MSDLIIDQVVATLRTLPDDLQQTDPVGIPGKTLVQFAGLIDLDDLALMRQAIKEDCEQVDLSLLKKG